MRVAALYDIHGNDAALAAVLAEIEALGVDLIVRRRRRRGRPVPVRDRRCRAGPRRPRDRDPRQRRARARRGAAAPRRRHRAHRSRRRLVVAHALGGGRARAGAARLDGARLPPLSSVEIDGLGDVLFCHASPRSDEEIVTPLSTRGAHRADVRGRRPAHGRARPHARAVRARRRRGRASSTRAASACRTRRGRPRTGRCSGPDVELRSTPYDVDGASPRACARAASRRPRTSPTGSARPPGPDEANEFFERMATRRRRRSTSPGLAAAASFASMPSSSRSSPCSKRVAAVIASTTSSHVCARVAVAEQRLDVRVLARVAICASKCGSSSAITSSVPARLNDAATSPVRKT